MPRYRQGFDGFTTDFEHERRIADLRLAVPVIRQKVSILKRRRTESERQIRALQQRLSWVYEELERAKEQTA